MKLLKEIYGSFSTAFLISSLVTLAIVVTLGPLIVSTQTIGDHIDGPLEIIGFIFSWIWLVAGLSAIGAIVKYLTEKYQ